MSPLAIGLLAFTALVFLLLLRVPIGFSMLMVGAGGLLMTKGPVFAEYALSATPYSAIYSFTLAAIPMFILMGNLANAAGVTTELYDTGYKLLGRLPGGLGMATVFACAGFAATTGSSVGMVAAMTRIALPEMDRYGYDRRLSLGAIAGAGTLGILIPPSIPAVMYAITTEQSVGRILLGGVIPGIIMAVTMLAYLGLRCKLNPKLAPVASKKIPLCEKIRSLKGVWTIAVLFGGVIGSIYLGWATATEAAAVGCLGAIIIAALKRTLKWVAIKSALTDSVKMTCMIMMISVGAAVFQLFLMRCGFASAFSGFFIGANMSKMSVVILMLAIYIPLGMFFDTMGMILLTVPIFHPIMMNLGIDPIWFGTMLIIMIQISLLSPPVGLNVFVLKGCVPNSSLGQIFAASVPWMFIQILVVALLLIFPQLVIWLPNLMK
ncbi:MAG: TRAP transporter large permease subunit [Candidatus Adiutrix sp.]|jgi:tripartite ATP-independent transporter DctM subunit|nr:TRAP transporter large permease subunit [Candidatus Adiutrix sp.]